IRSGLTHIWEVMEACKDSALTRTGVLPGGLNVRRRAPEWHRRLSEQDPDRDPVFWQEWVNLVALAVNEENATGGRVVSAPTNGAAGIIPAVLFYATHYSHGASGWSADEKQRVIGDFLLAAAAVGVLYKEQASISGAEVGCQGEVGSASSMAAAGLAQVLGGTPAQVENAAEIAMEHNLGLTCDPIGGLVQIPCIERNAIAASKAINAAKMALMGDGSHRVSLDEVIVTMRETGRDMSAKYKETAMGGLAVNVTVC
ncbi:MAG: L-serine ammonia-lyase, partial [Actinobacteria bacterium]|nr:L-serine ammonia-lyase [Actinomycetota bacterium]